MNAEPGVSMTISGQLLGRSRSLGSNEPNEPNELLGLQLPQTPLDYLFDMPPHRADGWCMAHRFGLTHRKFLKPSLTTIPMAWHTFIDQGFIDQSLDAFPEGPIATYQSRLGRFLPLLRRRF